MRPKAVRFSSRSTEAVPQGTGHLCHAVRIETSNALHGRFRDAEVGASFVSWTFVIPTGFTEHRIAERGITVG